MRQQSERKSLRAKHADELHVLEAKQAEVNSLEAVIVSPMSFRVRRRPTRRASKSRQQTPRTAPSNSHQKRTLRRFPPTLRYPRR